MITLDIEKYIQLSVEKNFKIFGEQSHKPYNLNIVGLRNRFARTNYFDDTLAVYYERDGIWCQHFYEATTMPGKDSLLKPENINGAAILVPSQYEGAYKIGKHKGQYEALVQDEAVDVYRDSNKDLVYDADKRTVQRGFFGINIHKASFGAKLVGPNSAGCQVFKYSNDFTSFMFLCKKAANFWGNKFTYTLVEI